MGKGLGGISVRKVSINATLEVVYTESVYTTKIMGKDGFRIFNGCAAKMV